MRDIQILNSFANFYYQFIYKFSKIAALFTLILKILKIKVLLEKNNNFENNKNDKNNNNVTVKKNGKASNKNLILRSSFLIFGAKIVFAY